MRDQRHPRRQAEASHRLGGEPRHPGHLLGRRVAVDVGVADEERVPRQLQQVHGREAARPLAQAHHVGDVAQVVAVAPEGAAQHGVGPALAQQHGRDQRAVAPHLGRRGVPLDAPAPAEPVVRPDRALDQILVVEARHLDVAAGRHAEAEVPDPGRDRVGPADQDRPGDFKVLLPLIAPGLVTTGLLAFIAAWNEYLFALSFIQTPDNYTVPIAITSFVGKSGSAFQQPWGEIMAATIIVTLPLIAAVLILQKRILAGLTAGAVKG